MAHPDPAKPRTTATQSPSSASIGHPPRLELRIVRHIKILLLLNILPLAALAWVGYAWWQKKIEFNTGQFSNRNWLTLAVILGSCVVIALAAWVILPIARWLRDYPRWHFAHSPTTWFVPMLGGYCLWATLCGLGFLAIGGAGAVIVTGVYHLWSHR